MAITYIDQTEISNKRILLRVDFNVALNANNTIADDTRIQQSLPTIKYLLSKGNKLVIVSHLGRPKVRDEQSSLKKAAEKLQEYVPEYTVRLIDDFITESPDTFHNQQPNEIFMLENMRYYPEEKLNDVDFSKKLASLAEIYVNDAFGVCHRADASVVGVPKLLPKFGGLLLKKEIEMISKINQHPEKPVTAIMGGAKISSKLNLIGKLLESSDHMIIGGGLANTFFEAEGIEIGKSICQYEEVENARRILYAGAQKDCVIHLPEDVVVGNKDDTLSAGVVKNIHQLSEDDVILDIGPETLAKWGSIINKSKTIVWNGPIGYFENPIFRRGSDFIYYAITDAQDATSIVGGGDTLAVISKKEYLEKITHISTGGGAMLEFIEKGTLPGIDALA